MCEYLYLTRPQIRDKGDGYFGNGLELLGRDGWQLAAIDRDDV